MCACVCVQGVKKGEEGVRSTMTMECCGCRCHQSETSGFVRIEELDRVVAMASAALQAKSRHIEAEAAARQAVEAELTVLRRDTNMIRAKQDTIVDDETAFIRSQVEALLKTKAVMAREAQELTFTPKLSKKSFTLTLWYLTR